MLMRTRRVKGDIITNVEDLKKSMKGVFVEDKELPKYNSFVIDNPFNFGMKEEEVKEWLTKHKEKYNLYAWIEVPRETVFPDDIDYLLEDYFLEFSYNYDADSYTDSNERMFVNLLEKLKGEFIITKR